MSKKIVAAGDELFTIEVHYADGTSHVWMSASLHVTPFGMLQVKVTGSEEMTFISPQQVKYITMLPSKVRGAKAV